MNPQILVWLLLAPFAGAPILYLARGKVQDLLAALLPSIYLILGLAAVFAGRRAFPIEATLGAMPWLDAAGVLPLRLDALSSILLLVVLIVGLLVALFSIAYMGPANRDHPVIDREGNGRYYFFLSAFIGSMVGVAVSGNLLVLFFFWECTTLCSWALISHHHESGTAVRAAFKALVMTHVGGVFFIVAIALVFGYTGSFAFAGLRQIEPGVRTAVFLCLLVAASAKSAQVPLFTWLPDAMAAPTPISAYLHAAAMVKAGVYLMARIVVESGTLPGWAGGLMAGLALVTMMSGLILYFFQDDLKRFLAYSTIAQLGYVMLGVSLLLLGSRTGYVAGVLHIACHAVAKALLFLCVGAMAMRLGVKKISLISGLSTKMPVASACFFVGLLAVTGIPPFSCFWSKLALVIGIFELQGPAMVLISVPFYLEVVITFLWFLRVGQRLLFGAPSPAVLAAPHDREAGGMLVPNAVLVTLAVLTLVMPLIVYPFLSAL